MTIPTQNSLQTAVTDSKQFVKDRFTGGIGAVIQPAPKTGLPTINSVLPGSPAQGAGLLPGDTITAVDGWPTAGQLLKPVIDHLHGIAGGEVKVTVQRGSTNLTFLLSRSSWHTMGVTTAPGIPVPVMATNSAVR